MRVSELPEMKQVLEQYFLLLNGKRPMTGSLTTPYVATEYVTFDRAYQDTLIYRKSAETLEVYPNLEVYENFYWKNFLPSVKNAYIRTKLETDSSISFQAQRTFPAYQQTCAILQGGAEPSWEIPRAGNISLLDDKFLKVGKDSDSSLPTPSADYRGKVIRIEGGSGEADHVYMCLKQADESYVWSQLD